MSALSAKPTLTVQQAKVGEGPGADRSEKGRLSSAALPEYFAWLAQNRLWKAYCHHGIQGDVGWKRPPGAL